MDYIKRKICLEGARTRTQGLMPYYEFGKEYSQHEPYYVSVCNECDYKGDDVFDECPRCGSKDVEIKPACKDIDSIGLESVEGNDNGNWGHFVANPCFLAEKDKTYETMLHNYYSILNMVRSGVKLRKVETKEGEIIFTEDIGGFTFGDCPSGGTGFIGGDEPDYLYAYASYDAKNFVSSQIESLRAETRNIYRAIEPVDDKHTYIVLIDDYDKFSGMMNYFSGVDIPASITEKTIGTDEHLKWADYCEIVDDMIGRINIPLWIYNKHIKVPKSMPCAEVKGYKEWLESYQNLSADCCNMRLWEDMGGEDMLDFLSDYEDVCEDKREALERLDYSVPYIEIPLLIRQNYTDVGVLTNIDGVDYDETISGAVRSDNTRPHGYLSANTEYEESGLTEHDIALLVHSGLGLTIDEIIMGNKIEHHPTTEEFETSASIYTDDSGFTRYPIEVESLLRTLRTKKIYTDDQDMLLPGIFKPLSDNLFFVCKKSGDEWEILEYSGSSKDLVNGDGMTSEDIAGSNFYRSVTTKSAAKRIAEVYEEENRDAEPTEFYFKVKYDNSSTSPMTIPYNSGNTANVYYVTSGNTPEDPYIYRGDFIIDVQSANSIFEATYVIGGYYRGDSHGKFVKYIGSGDVYYEKYTIQSGHVDYVALDGVDNVPIYSDYIDFDGAAKEFYSPRYNLYRTGNTANIVSAATGDVWRKEFAYDAYLTKEDYLTNFSLPPKVDVNVTIDRGGASAFEKHYKLSECNTIQDLVNYGNHYFFPE